MLKIRDSRSWTHNSRVGGTFPALTHGQLPIFLPRPGYTARNKRPTSPDGSVICTGYAVVVCPKEVRTGYSVAISPEDPAPFEVADAPLVAQTGYAVAISSQVDLPSPLTTGAELCAVGIDTLSGPQMEPQKLSTSPSSVPYSLVSPPSPIRLDEANHTLHGDDILRTGQSQVISSNKNKAPLDITPSISVVNPSSLLDTPMSEEVVAFETLTESVKYNASTELPACYISDLNLIDGTAVSAGSRYTKMWLVHNNGLSSWPEGSRITFTSGFHNIVGNSFPVPAALPNEVVEIAIKSIAPEESGDYAQFWRLVDPLGHKFGDQLWLRLQVVVGDQLSSETGYSSLSASASFHLPRFEPGGTLDSAPSISSPERFPDNIRPNTGSLVESLNKHDLQNENQSGHTQHSLSLGSKGESESICSEEFTARDSQDHEVEDYEIVTDSDLSDDDGESLVEL